MKKRLLFLAIAQALAVYFGGAANAATSANPILASIEAQGVAVQKMDDASLDKVRGAALIYGQPMPSVTAGLKQHYVTYKGWGSTSDYFSYNYIGYGYNPSNNYTYSYGGYTYRVAGDQWLADRTSSPTAWNAAYASMIEYHYQVLDPNTAAPTPYAFRETAWNRPISTFRW